MAQTPERKKEYHKKYYKNNKTKWTKCSEEKKEKKIEYDRKYNKDNKERRKAQRELNKEKAKKQKKEYYKNNKELLLKKSAERYERNKEKIKERLINYNLTHKDHKNKWERNRRTTDPLFKLSQNIRRLIQFSFKRKGIKKNSKTNKILGCSNQEFKEHIEKQFESWMNWENYGVYKKNDKRTWNIDHIIPIDSAKTKEDIIILNHFINLRPLCSKENNNKRAKII